MRWAREGLVCVRDVLNGTCFVGGRAFTRDHPELSVDTFRRLMADMPPQWSVALQRGEGLEQARGSALWDAASRGQRGWEGGAARNGGRGADDAAAAEKEAARRRELAQPQRVYVTKRPTLCVRTGKEVRALRQSDIYDCLVAEYWRMPRTFDASRAHAHYAHLFEHWPEAHRGPPISLALRRARHPCVPAPMTDVAVRVAHSGFLIGPVKCQGLRAKCHCEQRQHDETVEHAYMRWALRACASAVDVGAWRVGARDR